MIFQITDKLRISSMSKYAWEVEELVTGQDPSKKNYGKSTWSMLTSHSNLKMACESIIDKGFLLSEDLRAVLRFMDDVYKFVERAEPVINERYKA